MYIYIYIYILCNNQHYDIWVCQKFEPLDPPTTSTDLAMSRGSNGNFHGFFRKYLVLMECKRHVHIPNFKKGHFASDPSLFMETGHFFQVARIMKTPLRF